MKDSIYIFYSLKSRWLNCMLSIFLTAFGVAMAVLITQFSNNIQNRLTNDGKGIDIVIGAKGSPLQIVLSSIYHVDIPTGNVPFNAVEKFTNHPQVKSAIPLALGDSWRGNRIVGTTKEYLEHYEAEIANGRNWKSEYEVVVGSLVNLKINAEFLGSHGLYDGGKEHQEHKYKVVGVMHPTGSVLDRLILTDLNSVLEMHDHEKVDLNNFNSIKSKNGKESHHHSPNDGYYNNPKPEEQSKHMHDQHEHEKHDHDEQHHEKIKSKKNINKSGISEITALLLITKTPIANINLPLKINKETSLQAANPAKEITRLTSILGLGSKSLGILSIVLISFAILSVFSGLAANLENRMGDLAVLRAIGYSKNRIFKIICIEGISIVLTGLIVGIMISILIFYAFVSTFGVSNTIQFEFIFSPHLTYIIAIVLLAGLLASLFPAYTYSKISVANQLTKNI